MSSQKERWGEKNSLPKWASVGKVGKVGAGQVLTQEARYPVGGEGELVGWWLDTPRMFSSRPEEYLPDSIVGR